jgi:hypothetical protein
MVADGRHGGNPGHALSVASLSRTPARRGRAMDQIDTTTAVREPSRRRLGLDRLRLRFRDPALESAFRADRFRHQLGNIRFAFLVGIVLWISWGLLLRPYILAVSELRLDRIMPWGVFIGCGRRRDGVPLRERPPLIGPRRQPAWCGGVASPWTGAVPSGGTSPEATCRTARTIPR